MPDKNPEVNTQTSTQSNSSLEKIQLKESIFNLISFLPTSPNKKAFVNYKIDYALSNFPNNYRAAYLLAKKDCYQLTEKELEELKTYCFFPQEHPDLKNSIKDIKSIRINNRQIEVVNQNPDFDINLDDQHIKMLINALKIVSDRTPQIAQNLLKIFLIKTPDAEKQEYGPNGKYTKRQCDDFPTGIILTQQGYRFDIDHRIAGVNNLQGTITHELGHMINYLYPDFIDKYKTTLGYHSIIEIKNGSIIIIDNEWEKIIENNQVVYLHKSTGKKSYDGFIPKDITLLPSNYACFYLDEDISDSFVAWIFKKPLEVTRRKLFDELFQKNE